MPRYNRDMAATHDREYQAEDGNYASDGDLFHDDDVEEILKREQEDSK